MHVGMHVYVWVGRYVRMHACSQSRIKVILALHGVRLFCIIYMHVCSALTCMYAFVFVTCA